MKALWDRYWWPFLVALIGTTAGIITIESLGLKLGFWMYMLGWWACSAFNAALAPAVRKAIPEAGAFAQYLRKRADWARAKGFFADNNRDRYSDDLEKAADKLDVAAAALKSASELNEFICAEISSRVYRSEEQKDPTAWDDIDDPMHDGRLASYRDEFEEARRIVGEV